MSNFAQPYKKRKLPLGSVQTFSCVIEDYDVYIDKTAIILEMINNYKVVFLSRPRRFGKSLTCSTLGSIFKNERELFKGLTIDESDWEWKEYPVIHLDLGSGNYHNGVDTLRESLNIQLESHARKYGVAHKEGGISAGLSCLIEALYEAKGKVVVIIDEYDNPLLSTIDKPDINESLRNELRGFYSVLKSSDRFLKFIFITGVTKFSQVSMFSGMNQPTDISMMPEFADLCGVTQEELEKYFDYEIEHISEGSREVYLSKLRDYYNGYRFSRKKLTVYNPVGLMLHFHSDGEFLPYWNQTGTPAFVLKYLEKHDLDFIGVENAELKAQGFGDYRDTTLTLIPILYQAGYLTITDYDSEIGTYILNYPNTEIRSTFAEFISHSFTGVTQSLLQSKSTELLRALRSGNAEAFINGLIPYLSRVDYSLASKITEYYFEFAVSNIINMIGFPCFNEVHTANGRMDSVIFAGDYIYIIEFKVNKPVEDAIAQFVKKDYASVYADNGKKLIKLAVVFDREKRNIERWERVM